MFARYAAVVKNLRGIALFDLGEEGSWDSVEWLVRRFRYRDLGVTLWKPRPLGWGGVWKVYILLL